MKSNTQMANNVNRAKYEARSAATSQWMTLLARLGYAVTGIANAAQGVGGHQIVVGSGNVGKSTTASTQDWTALLLKQPFDVALVLLVGLVVIGLAFYMFSEAYTARFRARLNLTGLTTQVWKWVVGLGRIGYAALGVVFAIIGIFLTVAAVQHNARKALGLDGTLKELAHQPFGSWLLSILALGLVASGVYSFVEARSWSIGRF